MGIDELSGAGWSKGFDYVIERDTTQEDKFFKALGKVSIFKWDELTNKYVEVK